MVLPPCKTAYLYGIMFTIDTNRLQLHAMIMHIHIHIHIHIHVRVYV